MDLFARVIRSDTGIVPSKHFIVECVNGANAKGDVLTYCLRFDNESSRPPANVDLTVYLCHAAPEQQTHNGKPELRFSITGSQIDFSEETAFVPGLGNGVCDVIFRAGLHTRKEHAMRYAELYFVVEDCDTTLPTSYKSGKLDTQYASGAGPKWRLGTDTSGLLHRLFPRNWFPLAPVSPDSSDPKAVAIPMQEHPQRHPAWYTFRSTVESTPVPGLSGKLSGTKWFKMLGKYSKDGLSEPAFAGNALTRSGRVMETPVTALYLTYLATCRPDVKVMECGSFPHPTIPDTMATPDGLLIDPQRTFDSLPPWFQTEMQVAYKEATLKKIDFSRGVYECKTALKRGSKGEGAVFKEEHVAQLYAEMICTGVFWAEIVRYCAEAKEMFMYRVYRKPTIAAMFERVASRTREELIAGKAFKDVINHDDNRALISECAKYAVYYNTPRTKDQRRTPIPCDVPVFSMIMQEIEAASGVLSPSDPQAEVPIPPPGTEVGVLATQGKRKKATAKKPTAAKKQAATRHGIRRQRISEEAAEVSRKRHRADIEAWHQIEATNEQIERAIGNSDWDQITGSGVLLVQAARYKLFSEMLAAESSSSSVQDEKQ